MKDNESEGGPSTSTGRLGGNNDLPHQPSKPKGLFPTAKKIKSFAAFRKAKGKQWKKSVSPKDSDSDGGKSKEREVCINIGLFDWNYKENILKPKRGKKLVLRVSNKVNYKTLCNKAVEKWKAFYSHLYVETNEYVLLYENGEEALFLRGSKKEFFSLERYQQELGKDFNRITLFLCTSVDYRISQGLNDSDGDNDILNCDIPDEMDQFARPLPDDTIQTPKRLKIEEENNQKDIQIQSDEKIAIELQQIFEEELSSVTNEEESAPQVQDTHDTKQEEFTDQASVIQHLEKMNDNDNQFFIVMRRKVPFFRVLTLWQREAKKTSPMKKLTVKYVGEDGIDTGALAREFLTECVESMRSDMFPNGCPIDSTYHIQNGNFRTCGQIAAVSLAQGGPSPSLFEECVYDTLINPDIDMTNLSVEKHLSKSEKKIVEIIKHDVKGNQDIILDNGYTGLVDDEHIDEIVGSVMISLVSKRIMYLKEFARGLSLYGVDELLSKAPGLCKSFFVQGMIQDTIDANYLFSCMQPEFSDPGTTRRELEERVVDNIQDFLNNIEDNNVSGYSAPVAWNYDDEDGDKEKLFDDSPEEKFETPDVTVPGMMMWLTAQKHKPLNGKKMVIMIYFDHECKTRDPKPTICFPLVGACGMQITFPIAHMVDPSEFHTNLLVAYSKGQAFGKP